MPDRATVPLFEFLQAERELLGMIVFNRRAHESLTEVTNLVINILPGERDRGYVDAVAISRRYTPILRQLLLTKSVDSYLVYVAKVLTLIFCAKPETLRSSEQVPIKYVLQHSTMKELIRTLADDQVIKLAYKGMRDLSASVKRRLGLSLFSTAEDLNLAIEFIELRNLIVHNDGVVNRLVGRKLPQYKSQIGQRVEISAEKAHQAAAFLSWSAAEFDELAQAKFALPVRTAPDCIRSGGNAEAGEAPTSTST